MNKNLAVKIIILVSILAAAIILGILKGAADIPLQALFSADNRQILHLRFLRILTAIIAGSGLAVSGIALQAILRNPLAEPYLLGTSSGAGLGAVIGIFAGVSQLYLPLIAFIGAAISVFLVYNLARQNNRIPEYSLILSGVIISVALSAIMVFFISISGNEAMHGLTWWLWGSLQVYDIRLLLLVSAVVGAGIIFIYIFAQDLNAISMGEEEAAHLGIETQKVKKILILATSLVTASLVCICGIIGFVGLIVPHAVRMICGPNHKVLIPLSCISAAIFMVVCDTFSRVLLPPMEIPIGVITAILGAPVFIFLLKKRQKVK